MSGGRAVPVTGSSSSGIPGVELVRVRRSFGSVAALRAGSLTAFRGEVHGLLGENGAGKTTLMRILAGFERPDGGLLRVSGAEADVSNPRVAAAAGIGMVHQHFTLVPALTALENVALGIPRRGLGLTLPLDEVRERVAGLMDRTGLLVDLDEPAENMSVGARQRVEILRVLYRDPAVLILDEPTAVLAPPEVETLFAVVRRLARDDRTVILIAHNLQEVLSIADRVTVLRGGETVLERPRSEVDHEGLARAMVGTTVDPLEPPEPSEAGDVVAQLRGVSARSPGGGEGLRSATLTVRRGEIVGIAGVEGNGQRELARVLAGLDSPRSGSATVAEGPGWIPQDRTHEGLVPSLSLTENVALGELGPGGDSSPLLGWARVRAETLTLLERFRVQASGPHQRAGHLSGGNQQKVVVGRELSRSGDLLVAENPTRGLDVSAARFVQSELLRLRGGGVGAPGIVLISTDLDEVLALSDRVFVLLKGTLSPIPPGQASRENVGRLMLGARAPGKGEA